MRIQPAHSRAVIAREGERLTLTMPPVGPLSFPGFCALLSALFTLLCIVGVLYFLRFMPPMALFVSALALVGLGGLLFCTGLCVSSWSIVRSPGDVVYTTQGIWGRRIRRWHSADVRSFWVQEGTPHSNAPPYFLLVIGFANGRNDTIRGGTNPEELRWMATILSDIKGRRERAEAPSWSIEGPAPRPMESVQPDTVTLRKFDSGIELTFLPELRLEFRKKRLIGISAVLLLGIAAGAWALRGRLPPFAAPAAAALVIAVALLRTRILLQTAVVQILDGLVTVVQNFGLRRSQFPLVDVEFVQTWRNRRRSELQFLVRGRPKLRLLQGRPHEELEWAARLLRVAIRGKVETEPTRLQVDAAAGVCQVCAEKMERRVVYCGKCRTPHHEECWAYIGTCSTYGCREMRFTREAS